MKKILNKVKIGWKTCINYFHLPLSLQPCEVHMLQSTKWNERRKQRKMEKKEKKNIETGQPGRTKRDEKLLFLSDQVYICTLNAQMRIIKLCRLLYPPPNHSSKAFNFVHQNVYPFFIIVCQFTAPMSFWKLFVFHRRFLSLLGRETVTFNTRT